MKAAVVLLAMAGLASAHVLPLWDDPKPADKEFVIKQKKVLELFPNLMNSENFKNEFSDIDMESLKDKITDVTVYDKFFESYKYGMLPKDDFFTLSCQFTKADTIRIFELFYFAQDFDTFYKIASWAKPRINPVQFIYAYMLALFHREDCKEFYLPPPYEVLPSYFVPENVMHKIYNDYMKGIRHSKYSYNSSGCEYNYHSPMFGGPLGPDSYEPNLEDKVSYFREDAGLNAFYGAYELRNPAWMTFDKYKKSYFRPGEAFYYTHQQLLARYTLERLSNGLPYPGYLYWEKPLAAGYTPRISHFNGVSFYTRPDNIILRQFNKNYAHKAFTYETRLRESIDGESIWFWDSTNDTSPLELNNDDGVDYLGRVIYGPIEQKNVQARKYFGNIHYTTLEAIAFASRKADKTFNGGVTSLAGTAARDPAFYNYLHRLVRLFQSHKNLLPKYGKEDLLFPGVKITGVEVDKLVTYFDNFAFEVTHAIPVNNTDEYKTTELFVSTPRLNHKPFTYKINGNSDKAYKGIARVFIGPQYDSAEYKLSLEQKRLLMVEIDRFPVSLPGGDFSLERNSKNSPAFGGQFLGFRDLKDKIEKALNGEKFYPHTRKTCGVPEWLQLPRGSESGIPYNFYVTLNSFEKELIPDPKVHGTCGSNKLYDYRSYGFPFDRPIFNSYYFDVPNFFNADVKIYHRTESEINRPQ